MNCDQVFDILTRGPFPTGTSCDIPVEAHLDVCPECRRLAEALRPALELFQEAVAPEESRDLPGYWCAVAADRPQSSVSFAHEPKLPRRELPRVWNQPVATSSFSALTVWRMAAMLALGMTLGLLASTRSTWDGISRMPPFWSGTVLSGEPHGEPAALAIIASDQAEIATLPAACFDFKPSVNLRYTLRGDPLLAKADLEKLKCCSGCHNSASDRVPSTATLKVTQQCQLCHNDSKPLTHAN